MKYEARVNGVEAQFTREGNRLRYESGGVFDAEFDAAECGEGQYSVLLGLRSYAVTVLSANEIQVNGRVYRVEVFDPRDRRARRPHESSAEKHIIASPMAGRVIRVTVEKGQTVEAGQGLIVVEAMKMQNEMKSPGRGVVAEIQVQAGDPVTAGQELMVVEPVVAT